MSELSPDRVGCITASRIDDMMAGGKGITRARYAAQLAAERMTGMPHRFNFITSAMEHGVEFEPVARMKYEIRNGVMVAGTGKEFILHPFIENFGCSPDGLVDDDGMVEIKNPETHTFIQYAVNESIPDNYRWQMLAQLTCTRRKWNDWVAHDPDLPEEDGYLQIRFAPTSEQITNLEREVRFFNAEIDQIIKSIKEKRK